MLEQSLFAWIQLNGVHVESDAVTGRAHALVERLLIGRAQSAHMRLYPQSLIHPTHTCSRSQTGSDMCVVSHSLTRNCARPHKGTQGGVGARKRIQTMYAPTPTWGTHTHTQT